MERIIKKAIENGYDITRHAHETDHLDSLEGLEFYKINVFPFHGDGRFDLILKKPSEDTSVPDFYHTFMVSLYELIFSHAFAKAYFGEEEYENTPTVILSTKDKFSTLENKWEADHYKFLYPKKYKKLIKGEMIEEGKKVLWFTYERECVSKGWQYHLQQMVLEEDPVEYLKRFL
jgi:hypothetical protein